MNDDGIQSVGLLSLKRKLDELAKVVVIAPKEEVSGIGKAISAKHVQIEEVELSDGSKAYATSGTPADSYLLGVNKVLKRSPNLLVAGINLGPNLGIDDFLNSGTLGAAIEAAIHGVPAIAVSYCKQRITDRKTDKASVTPKQLELTAGLAQKIVKLVLDEGMPQDVDILSVNVPENLECEKVKVTKLSYVGYGDLYTREERGYRIADWRLADYDDPDRETDVYVVKEEGCVSITPIKIMLRHNRETLKSMLKNVGLPYGAS